MGQPAGMIRRRSLFPLPLLALAWPVDRARAAEDIGLAVPGVRARRLAVFSLGEATAVALAFGADLPEGERDLLAITAAGQVLALEILVWHGADGSRLQTRLAAVPDRQRLRLQRTASIRRGHANRREDWTDYLSWQGAAPMADAPVRPVLAGTWQAALAAQRQEMRAALAAGQALAALVACCPPPLFPPQG